MERAVQCTACITDKIFPVQLETVNRDRRKSTVGILPINLSPILQLLS
jgi:hypothetical protein